MAIFKTPKWIGQVRDTYRLTAPLDPAIKWIIPVTFLGTTAVLTGLGMAVGGWALIFVVTGWAWGLLATAYVFGRRAEKAAYGSIEGTPGASAQVVKTIRSGFFVTPAVEVNKAQELVHRVVCRAGVVLLIEARPGSAIGQTAKQKTARWVGETPITEVFVGTGEGQISLVNLNRHLRKLPKVLRPAEVTDLRRKLDAVACGSLPIPKGPMPKGLRMPRR